MKSFRNLIVGFMIFATMLSSRPSQAAVGAIFAPGLVMVGLVMTVGGVVTTPLAIRCMGHGACGGGMDRALGLVGLVGWASALLGIVVLDGGQAVAFAPVSEKEARKLGLTADELNSFNDEVDQVNALPAHVDSELQNVEKADLEDSVAVWNSVKDVLAPATLSALAKITSQK